MVCLYRQDASGTLKASITSFGARGIWQNLRLIFVITESRVGKASRLTSSAGGGPESKPGRLTYFSGKVSRDGLPTIEWNRGRGLGKCTGCESSIPPVRALRRFTFYRTAGITWRLPTPEAGTVDGAIWR